MSETLNIRDVDPQTKAVLAAHAEKAGLSLAAFLRLKLDEIAGRPRRQAGSLADRLAAVGEPADGWGPMDSAEAAAWEAEDDWAAS